MKQCWSHHGLTEHGAELAEGAIDEMCRLLEKCEDKGGVAEMVLREAIFRRVYLPQRAKEFRDRYFEINGKPHPREDPPCLQIPCRRQDDGACEKLGHCVFEKCEHGRFYNEVCEPCRRD
jgi:hypothetical protein